MSSILCIVALLCAIVSWLSIELLEMSDAGGVWSGSDLLSNEKYSVCSCAAAMNRILSVGQETMNTRLPFSETQSQHPFGTVSR